MTYCLAMRLQEGLVLLSDTRTSAGIDTVGTYRKRHTFALDPQRTIVIQFWERRLRESFAGLPEVRP
jgi:putative proteasome-type protease